MQWPREKRAEKQGKYKLDCNGEGENWKTGQLSTARTLKVQMVRKYKNPLTKF